MKYPRLAFEDNRSKKLSEEDLSEIKRLRLEEGLTYKKIAEKFEVNYATVYYHLNEDYRRKMLKNANDRSSDRWHFLSKDERKKQQKSHYEKYAKRKRQIQKIEYALYKKEHDAKRYERKKAA